MFNIDIETCKTCGGHLKIIACIEDPVVIEKILTPLERKDASATAARLPPCRAPPPDTTRVRTAAATPGGRVAVGPTVEKRRQIG